MDSDVFADSTGDRPRTSGAWRRRAFLVIALAATAILAAAGVSAAQPVKPPLPFPIPPAPPEFDPGFYHPDQAIVDSKQPGEIIAARQVHLAYASVLPINMDAWQLSFRSTDTHGRAIPAVTTVMKPHAPTATPRPLLSYQFAEDSLGQYCRPSYLSQVGSLGPLAGSAETTSLFAVPIAAAQMGWAVVVTDTQGPRQAFGAGPLEGRITLDGIRAAENFEPMQLDGGRTKVGMTGYSGGAMATGHAAELHREYAPELNIVGVAEGGIPADVGAALKMASGNAGAGIIFAGAVGAGREYPELADLFDKYLTPAGRAIVAAKQNLCQVPTSLVVPFVNFDSLFTIPHPLDDPRAVTVMDQIKMGHHVPDVPMFMLQSNPDWLVPVGPVNDLVATYCADPSARVQYLRDHFSEHLTLDTFAIPLMVKFIADRFDGIPAPSGCATKDAGSVLLAPELWTTLLPQIAPFMLNLLGKPVGQ
ncbi:lipase family protein [Nocardia nova]|uniref:lipase family protein n=1 Tax=Nocardia nova TaxID=37330 RepID=UPI0033F580AF